MGQFPFQIRTQYPGSGNGFMAALGMMIAAGNDEAGSTK